MLLGNKARNQPDGQRIFLDGFPFDFYSVRQGVRKCDITLEELCVDLYLIPLSPFSSPFTVLTLQYSSLLKTTIHPKKEMKINAQNDSVGHFSKLILRKQEML